MKALALSALLLSAAAQAAPAPRTTAEVLAQATPADWRQPNPEDLIYLELASGRVIFELAPAFAPKHAANIRALAREGYYDNLAIVRSQDNYVVQWGDPQEDEARRKPIAKAERALAPEFTRPWNKDLPFTKLADGDIYAPEVGHSGGFPAARDRKLGRAWLAHCYAMVGVGRGDTTDSGSGAELYVVIGHGPRHLDRNITLAGRVLKGMELLSTLPRGTGPLGFYEKAEQHVPIKSLRVAADVPEAERTPLEVLRTDTATFKDFVASRRTRRESWFVEPTGRVELCNINVPVRAPPAAK